MQKLGVTVYAASAETGDDAKKVADDVSFSVGEGVTRKTADEIGGWWEDKRSIVQPTEFLIRKDGTIVQSTYSDGPLGRIDAADVCSLVTYLISQ